MPHRIVKSLRYPKVLEVFPKFRLGAFLVAIFCAFLIVMATFTPLYLSLPFGGVYSYIPQIPIVIMTATMLGPKAAVFTVFLYVVTGLTGFPVFASGGGLEYFSNMKFGYILGFFPGAYIAGKALSEKATKLNILKAGLAGVIVIHIIGAIYLATILLLDQKESIHAIFEWLIKSSGLQILFDLFFGVIAAFIGRILRHVLWIVFD